MELDSTTPTAQVPSSNSHLGGLAGSLTALPWSVSILIICGLSGELLSKSLSLAVPGPVVGMMILAALLLITRAPQSHRADNAHDPGLESTAQALIRNMGLLFVPAGVGLADQLTLLRQEWLPILGALLGSTVLSLVVTGWVMHRVTARLERARTAPSP